MNEPDKISIQVAYGSAEKQTLKSFTVPVSTTVSEAALMARPSEDFPEIDWQNAKKGIFGQVVEDARLLAEGDRVELYRPLMMTPQEARRQRAKKGDE